jgi:hypothetical protein
VAASGAGGVDEMAAALDDQQAMYGLFVSTAKFDQVRVQCARESGIDLILALTIHFQSWGQFVRYHHKIHRQNSNRVFAIFTRRKC